MKSFKIGSTISYNNKNYTVVDMKVNFFLGQPEIDLVLSDGTEVQKEMGLSRFHAAVEEGRATIVAQ